MKIEFTLEEGDYITSLTHDQYNQMILYLKETGQFGEDRFIKIDEIYINENTSPPSYEGPICFELNPLKVFDKYKLEIIVSLVKLLLSFEGNKEKILSELSHKV